MDQTCPFRLRSRKKVAARDRGGGQAAAEGYDARGGFKLGRAENFAGIVLERRDCFERLRDRLTRSRRRRRMNVPTATSLRSEPVGGLRDRFARLRVKRRTDGPAINLPHPPGLQENGKQFARHKRENAEKSRLDQAAAARISCHEGHWRGEERARAKWASEALRWPAGGRGTNRR